jgi:hypothetical protein
VGKKKSTAPEQVFCEVGAVADYSYPQEDLAKFGYIHVREESRKFVKHTHLYQVPTRENTSQSRDERTALGTASSSSSSVACSACLVMLLALSLSVCTERDTHRHTHTNQRANPPGERGELVGENFVSYSCLRPKSCKSRGRRYREIRRDRDRWFGERDWLQEERKNKKLACVNWIDRSRVFGKREGKGGNGQELKNGTLESSFDV